MCVRTAARGSQRQRQSGNRTVAEAKCCVFERVGEQLVCDILAIARPTTMTMVHVRPCFSHGFHRQLFLSH